MMTYSASRLEGRCRAWAEALLLGLAESERGGDFVGDAGAEGLPAELGFRASTRCRERRSRARCGVDGLSESENLAKGRYSFFPVMPAFSSALNDRLLASRDDSSRHHATEPRIDEGVRAPICFPSAASKWCNNLFSSLRHFRGVGRDAAPAVGEAGELFLVRLFLALAGSAMGDFCRLFSCPTDIVVVSARSVRQQDGHARSNSRVPHGLIQPLSFPRQSQPRSNISLASWAFRCGMEHNSSR